MVIGRLEEPVGQVKVVVGKSATTSEACSRVRLRSRSHLQGKLICPSNRPYPLVIDNHPPLSLRAAAAAAALRRRDPVGSPSPAIAAVQPPSSPAPDPNSRRKIAENTAKKSQKFVRSCLNKSHGRLPPPPCSRPPPPARGRRRRRSRQTISASRRARPVSCRSEHSSLTRGPSARRSPPPPAPLVGRGTRE
jgi:hypothetical protein